MDAGGDPSRAGYLEAAVRILVLSNFYPPHFIGGYELACRDMVETLRARGHKMCVLTSTYGVGKTTQDGHVYRCLRTNLAWDIEKFHLYLIKLIGREFINQRAFKQLCRMFQPQVVYVWNPCSISLSLCFVAQQMRLPVCFFVFDHWLVKGGDLWCTLIDHQPDGTYRRLAWLAVRSLLRLTDLMPRSGVLPLQHVQFASRYLKEMALRAGKPVAHANVVSWGIDVERFPYKESAPQGTRLLYVGQIVPHKGVHTAVQALHTLVHRGDLTSATLTIVGSTPFPEYLAQLKRLIANFGLENKVSFMGQVARDELTSVYSDHDVLLFTSEWDEPFGITLLEAMAVGIPIVATATGGAVEILQDGINCLVFQKGDAAACATAVTRLFNDASLCERVRFGGRRTVEERFCLASAIDRIEQELLASIEHAHLA